MAEEQYYVVIDNQSAGPYTRKDIMGLLAESKIVSDTPCCPVGEKDWHPLSQYVQVAPGADAVTGLRHTMKVELPPRD